MPTPHMQIDDLQINKVQQYLG